MRIIGWKDYNLLSIQELRSDFSLFFLRLVTVYEVQPVVRVTLWSFERWEDDRETSFQQVRSQMRHATLHLLGLARL